jgi:hypothetical protein
MAGSAQGRHEDREEREKRLRRFLEIAGEAYIAATSPAKRIEAMLIYAQARKDLDEFVSEAHSG